MWDSEIPCLHALALHSDLAVLQELLYVEFRVRPLRACVVGVCLSMNVFVDDLVLINGVFGGKDVLIGVDECGCTLNFVPILL